MIPDKGGHGRAFSIGNNDEIKIITHAQNQHNRKTRPFLRPLESPRRRRTQRPARQIGQVSGGICLAQARRRRRAFLRAARQLQNGIPRPDGFAVRKRISDRSPWRGTPPGG